MDAQKLLIADSSEEFCLALTELLQSDYDVRCTHSGREALELLCRERFQVLVLDLMLPELDGLSLLEQADAEGVCPTVLVITPFLTEYIAEAASRFPIAYAMRPPCNIQAAADRIRDISRRPRKAEPKLDPETYIRELLHAFEFPTKRDGYTYLQAAMFLFAQDPTQPLTKELYPAAAARCGRPGIDVERPIRLTIEAAWVHHDNPAWQKYFPNFPQRPTNSEFLNRMAEDLREKYEWNQS